MKKSNKAHKQSCKESSKLLKLIVCVWLFVGLIFMNLCVFEPQNAKHNVQASSVSLGEISAQQIKYVQDNSFFVNFDRSDVSNISVHQTVIAGNENEVNEKMPTSVVSKVEKYAKSKFGKSYFIMGLIHFSLTENGVRMTDFSGLTNVEMEITVNGDVKNAKNSYRAVFVKLDENTENAIKDGSYALFDSVTDKFSGKTVTCSVKGKSGEGTQCLLTIDASTDGFIFVMNVGNSKGGVGLIIMIVGIVLSLILFIVILQIFRNYKREKLRIATTKKYDANEIKEAPKKMSDENADVVNGTGGSDKPRIIAPPRKPSTPNVVPQKPSVAPRKPTLPKK